MKLVDLDGMNITTDIHSSCALELGLDLEPAEDIPLENVKETIRNSQVDPHDWEDNVVTASWGPLMQEVIRCACITISIANIRSSLETVGDVHHRQSSTLAHRTLPVQTLPL